MPKPVILVIDDEEEILNTVRFVLSSDDYKVIVAKGGADGLHNATLERPDLVLLDITMPDIDGYEVLKRLKERKIRTRVIFLTAKVAHTRDLITLARSGVCDYITKPFSPVELQNSVRRALEIENPFDLRSDELAPVVNELLAAAAKLKYDNQKLMDDIQILGGNNQKLTDDIQTMANNNQKLTNDIQILENNNQKLTSNIQTLENDNQSLKKHNNWWIFTQRLIYLAVSIIVMRILYSIGAFNGTQSAAAFILLVFVLLLLPIERIRNLYAKTSKAEIGIDISDQS